MWRERRDDYNLKLVSKADIKIQRAFLEGRSVAQEGIYEILSPGKRHGEGFLPVLLRCFKHCSSLSRCLKRTAQIIRSVKDLISNTKPFCGLKLCKYAMNHQATCYSTSSQRACVG